MKRKHTHKQNILLIHSYKSCFGVIYDQFTLNNLITVDDLYISWNIWFLRMWINKENEEHEIRA